MFRSIFTKSLRDYRVAILAWGIGLGIILYAQYATYASQLAGASTTQLQQLVQQFSFFGETARIDTPGGFATFKAMGIVPLVLGIWTLLAGARMTRGEEERGAMDILLSTPQARSRLLTQKVLALAVATALLSVLIGLGILGGMASANITVDPAAALLASLNAGLVALFFGMLALLLAQFMSRGAAAGVSGALMALFYVLDGTGRADPSAAGLRPFSPFYYYNQSLPLVPGHSMSWGAVAVLVALCVLCAGLAVPLFLRRDVGRSALADVGAGRAVETAPAAKPAARVLARAARSLWVRDVALQALRRQGVAMFWWAVSLGIIAGYLVIVAQTSEKQIAALMGDSPFFKQLFSGTDIGTNAGFLSVLVFGYIPLIVTIFAGFMAYRWATDLDKGRLELVLGTPQSRWRVLLSRYAAVLVAAVGVTIFICLAILLSAQAANFTLDPGRVAAASFGMLPLELVTASLVFALAGLLPPGAVMGLMAAFVAVSYLAELLRTLLKLPEWVLNLSIFHQYGTPVMTGLSWEPFVGMLVVAAVLLGLGGAQFRRSDVDRGAIES